MPSDLSDLDASVAQIIEEWRKKLRRDEDAPPRSGERGRREFTLVATLLGASRSGAPQSVLDLVVAAAEYGALGRRERLEPGRVCDELALLRGVIWRRVKRMLDSGRERSEFVVSLDRAVTIASLAVLRGGYRQELSARGEWPAALNALVCDTLASSSALRLVTPSLVTTVPDSPPEPEPRA